MAETQHSPAPRVNNLPKTNLHEVDVKFVSEVVKVISSIDGASSMRLRINDKMPSTYTLSISNPPKMKSDPINQIKLLNSNVKHIYIDFNRQRLVIECWKFKKKPEEPKKRKRDTLDVSYNKLSSQYDLSTIDDLDKQHVEGIICFFVDNTELEFNISVRPSNADYRLSLMNLDKFESSITERLINKYGAFLNLLEFDFPQKRLILTVRRNDSRMETFTVVKRKKVKLR